MEAKNEIKMKKIDPTPFVYDKNPLHKLGEGAFGDVFLGFDESKMVPLAVKTISFQKIQTKYHHQGLVMEKFKTEIINMQIASSQYLVKLLAAHSSSRNLYMICEYCNGGSLKEFLKTRSYLTEWEALDFFKQILSAFRLLNQKKIVHRDLKPANILLHNFRIKIGDLGFSKTVEMHEQFLESMVGSPMYMSPQILTNMKYTQKTDIWSLGVILYEMLYGDGPWKIITSLEDLKQNVQKKIDFPKNFNISKKTKDLIKRMLKYDQNERIGWEELFGQYASEEGNEMMDENEESVGQIWKRVETHFSKWLYLDRQDQIIRILEENRVEFRQMTGNTEKAGDFFQFFYQAEINKAYLKQHQNKFFQTRNRITFLMYLFFQAYSLTKSYHLPLLYELMFLSIRHALNQLQNMLNNNYENTQHQELILNSLFFINGKQLISYEFQLLRQFYRFFFQQFYIHRINSSFGKEDSLKTNLKGLYNSDLGEDNLILHLLSNSLSNTFNYFKQMTQLNPETLYFTRVVYELKVNSKLFFVGKTNVLKNMEQWKVNVGSWKTQLGKVKGLETETLGSFLNRQMKWKPYQPMSLLNME